MEEYKKQVENMAKIVSEYEEKFKSFEEINLKSEAEIKEAENRESLLKQQISKMNAEIEAYKSALQNKENVVSELNDLKERFETYKENRKKSESVYGEEQFNLRKSMVELEKNKRDLETKLTDYENQIKSLEKEVQKYKSQAKEFEKNYKNATAQIEQNIINLEEHEKCIFIRILY